MGPAGGRRLGPVDRVQSWWTAQKQVMAPRNRARDAEGGERVRQEAPASWRIGRVWGPQSPHGLLLGTPGNPYGAVMLAAAGGAAPTASPPRVGDAGNGYSASPWTVTRGNSGEGPRGSAGPVAAVGKVKA